MTGAPLVICETIVAPPRSMPKGPLDAACDVYDDGCGDRVGLPAHLGHVATGNRAFERGSWIVARYLHGVAPPLIACPSSQWPRCSYSAFARERCSLRLIADFRRFRVPLQRCCARTLGPVCVRPEGRQFVLRRLSVDRETFELQSLHSWGQVGDSRGAHTRFTDCRADGSTLLRRQGLFSTQESNCEAPRLVHAAMPKSPRSGDDWR